ncbi:MAG: alpha/beta hydrolase [Phycisphaeraceae bacterium]|nr:alpha/beta hydrolase [Phycisphaeraceae bacterium]
MLSPWTIAGAEGFPIEGVAHVPTGRARGVAIIVHGFLGFMDYGMFPVLAGAMEDAGFIALRFNLSHSGISRESQTFDRPERFERDTWLRQIEDVHAVIDGAWRGEIPGRGMRHVLIGHSRGGATAILAAARRFDEGLSPVSSGVATLAAPDSCCMWAEETRREALARGYTEVRSNRTGQTLRIGGAWLTEQLEDPGAHDVPAHASRLGCPLLVIHGEDDATVPAACAHALAGSAGARGRLVLIPGADHVFNTPNPFPEGASAGPELASVIESLGRFCAACVGEW